eukprot:scaffold44431_cov23-Tisochrysis_lutea.AAC.1
MWANQAKVAEKFSVDGLVQCNGMLEEVTEMYSVPLADSDSESSFTMDMGGQQLSSTALMRAERAAQEERGAARSPAKSYLTGDWEPWTRRVPSEKKWSETTQWVA